MTNHNLSRTSPKGGPFIGTCMNCGQAGLPMIAATQECQNPANLTQEEALLLALGEHSEETTQ